MAAAPQPKSSRYGNTQISKGRPQVSPVPETPIIIQDKENPIPDKYEGDINFNKVVYSLKEFRDKIDLGFNELTSNTPNVNTQQFFDLYNELFFDIPKEGENSHTTIVQTSLDYLDNYVSPLQSIIDSKDVEIQSLNQQLLTIQGELSTLQIAAQEEEAADAAEDAAEAAAQSQYEGKYGTNYTTNPLISLGALKTNLRGISANEVNDLNISGNNLNKVEDELNQAYNDVIGGATRSYNAWKDAIEDVTGNNNQRAGCFIVLNDTRTNIASGIGEIAGEGPQI